MRKHLKNKKGFTIVEILAVVVILGVLAGVAIPMVYRYVTKSERQSYDTMAKSAQQATESYLLDHSLTSGTLRIKNLVADQYLENTVDPKDKSKNCDGYVVYNLISGDADTLDQYEYTVNLCCTNYQKAYAFPSGTVTDISHDNYCDALNSVDTNTGDLADPPTCTLSVTGVGSSGLYSSDVTVTMETTSIVLEKGLDIVSNSTNGMTSLQHTEDGKNITYYGFVKNEVGENSCQITFTKDTVAPSCPTITASVAKETWTNQGVSFNFTFDSDSFSYDWYTNKEDDSGWKSKHGNYSVTESTKTITGSGKRQVKLTVYDEIGNSRECINDNNYYYIDTVKPVVSDLRVELDASDNRYLYATITDSLSKVSAYAVTTTNTTPSSSSFIDVTDVSSYQLQYSIPFTGATYYVWGMDVAGNISEIKSLSATNLVQSITYNLNGGTAGSSAPSSGVTGKTITISNPTKSGSTFKGWTVAGADSSISGNMLTVGSANVTLTANWEDGKIPDFTYTGSYQVVYDDDTIITSGTNIRVSLTEAQKLYTGDYKIRFLTSGTLTIHDLRGTTSGIDVFLVGGGGNGGGTFASQAGRWGYSSAGGGGGGGYRTTKKAVSVSTTSYYITVGGARAASSAFNYTANPGKNGTSATGFDQWSAGGAGGSSGGEGGCNYNDGSAGVDGGCEFDDCSFSSRRYGGGGGGGHGHNGELAYSGRSSIGAPGAESAGGGGSGNNQYRGYNTHNGTANTGGGGGGASFVFDDYLASSNCWSSNGCFEVSDTTEYAAGTGGSGIVIIRNKR